MTSSCFAWTGHRQPKSEMIHCCQLNCICGYKIPTEICKGKAPHVMKTCRGCNVKYAYITDMDLHGSNL